MNKFASNKNKDWYNSYFEKHYKNKDMIREDIIANKEVLFQYLAQKKCLINSLSKINLDRESSKIIDIGCSTCSNLISLVNYGFKQENLYGVDINQKDIEISLNNFPKLNLTNENASKLSFQNNFFHLSMESTMFVQLTNNKVRESIANEMIRIVKPGGYLLLLDWRYDKSGDKRFLSLNKRRLIKLFKIGTKTTFLFTVPGMLVPPVGRFLSSNFYPAYFLTSSLFPFLIGQVGYILKKK